MIPCGPRAQAVLTPFLFREPDAPCFSPAEAMARRREERHAQRVTPEGDGNRPGYNARRREKRRSERKPGRAYTTSSYGKSIAKACEKAQVERWSPNQIRHTAGTEFRREFGLEAAQTILGHSRANTTEIYAERDERKAIEVARQIG